MAANIDALYQQLESLVQAGNVDQGKAVLNQLKVALLTADIPTDPAKACAATELGVLLAVAAADLDAFGRAAAQVQPYYAAGVKTPRKCHITGLILLHLLVENRLAEFHSELELLTEQEASEAFISFPVSLERQLMVGMYDQVLDHQPLPDASYQFFMDPLVMTVRDSIADCIEVSYQQLSIESAAALMKFGSSQELLDYIEMARDDWIVDNGVLTFQPATVSHTAADIPSQQWMKQSLTYATEMERIV